MTVFQDNICVNLDIFMFLQNNQCGEVLLSTSKGIYLQFPTKILQITSDSFGVTPIGLGLGRYEDFLTVLSPQPGDTVSIISGKIRFPKGDLIPKYTVSEDFPSPKAPHPQAIRHCAAQLAAACKPQSVAVLSAPLLLDTALTTEISPWCQKARPHLVRLLAALQESDFSSISKCVAALLGLGAGLTPSLDDVLLGILYGLLRLAPEQNNTRHLQTAIRGFAPEQTHAISAAYLSAVADGAAFSRLDDILRALGGEAPVDITQLMKIGSTSGSEMLLGLLLAANIMIQR
ncbi:MAG: DUF2877 domain-containing protein [Ruminococcaceae bacterium]|nr:DUF2877 domain-containing protein [Oscillospiraceae bacterium]